MFFSIAFLTPGVVLVLIYCGKIDYFPSGLTFGDGFIFIAVCLAYSSLYAVNVLSQFCAGLTLSWLISWILKLFFLPYRQALKLLKKNAKQWRLISFFSIHREEYLSLLAVGILVLIFVAYVIKVNPYKGLNLLASIFVISFFHGLLQNLVRSEHKKSQQKNKSVFVKTILVIGIISTPLLIMSAYSSQSYLLYRAMDAIGIRDESATIQLLGKYAEFAEQNDLEPSKSKGNSKRSGYYQDCKILLKGIGRNVVVEINNFRLIVPSQDILVGIREKSKLMTK